MLAAGVIAATVVGVPCALYALLTRRQRRTTREIRANARQRGWRYRLRRWQGDPTAFRIDGRSASGLSWILTSSSAGENAKGWSARLALRFPSLAGEADFAVVPRDAREHGPAAVELGLSPNVESRVAAFSGTLAEAAHFFRSARELPSGVPAFDEAYRVLALPERIARAFIDAALGERLLRWPADAVSPHSLLAWRDPFALHVEARLPAPPNSAAVSYFVEVAEELCGRIPAPVPSAFPPRFADRLIARFLRP